MQMDDGKYKFLRRDNCTYLSTNALDRIVARGLGQGIRTDLSTKPFLPLVNSEAQICCSDVDVTAAEVAFGQWALPKLKKELNSSDSLRAKQAIKSLLDRVHDPEMAVEAVRLQVIPRLVRLMVSEDPWVRQHVLMVLQVLGLQPGGKMAIVNHTAILRHLSTLISDTDKNVRLTAADTLLALATWYFGVEELIKQWFVVTVIHRLNTELDDDIMIVLLETLDLLLDHSSEAKQQCLNNEGIELAVLLEHSVAKIRAGAARVLAQLSKLSAGKQAVLQHRTDILATLTHLLQDQDAAVKTQAAAVLMHALCLTQAKLYCVKLPTPVLLVHCAQLYIQPSLQLYALKALTSLAEAPLGQAFLKNNIHLVQDIRPADATVERHKDNLMTIINRVI